MPFEYSLAKFIPFRDEAACARVRAITRADLCKHSNPDFKIAIVDDPVQFYSRFALDIVTRISDAAKAGRKCVLILPVGPVPQFAIAAEIINRLGIDCKHLITYNMDEYADDAGKTAPADWEGSFATAMRKAFFLQILDQTFQLLGHLLDLPRLKLLCGASCLGFLVDAIVQKGERKKGDRW